MSTPRYVPWYIMGMTREEMERYGSFPIDGEEPMTSLKSEKDGRVTVATSANHSIYGIELLPKNANGN